MSNLSPIQKMADLARLELSAEEHALFQKDLTQILNYVGQLSQLQMDHISPTAVASGTLNVLREDNAISSNLNEQLIEQSPEHVEDTLIKVPAVLPGEEIS